MASTQNSSVHKCTNIDICRCKENKANTHMYRYVKIGNCIWAMIQQQVFTNAVTHIYTIEQRSVIHGEKTMNYRSGLEASHNNSRYARDICTYTMLTRMHRLI